MRATRIVSAESREVDSEGVETAILIGVREGWYNRTTRRAKKFVFDQKDSKLVLFFMRHAILKFLAIGFAMTLAILAILVARMYLYIFVAWLAIVCYPLAVVVVIAYYTAWLAGLTALFVGVCNL